LSATDGRQTAVRIDRPSIGSEEPIVDGDSDYIHGQGGWVTSPPSGKIVRIEVEQGSQLPVQLEKAGHRLRHAGMTTRIGPDFRTVDVLELDLSGK
jgi:hypothetical protein